MAKLNRSHSSLPDASYKLALQKDVCAVSSVKAKIAALEGVQTDTVKTTSSSHTPKPDFERRFMTTHTQNVRSSSLRVHLFKPAETQQDTDFFGSSVSPHPKDVVMKSAMKGNTNISNKTSVSSASAMPLWNIQSKQEATTTLKPETQKPSLPSFPKPHQGTRLSTPPPPLPTAQKPKYIRTCETQNTLQNKSTDPSHPKKRPPDVLTLQSPPTKPNRTPSVDIHRFRRNRNTSNNGKKVLEMHLHLRKYC